MTQTLEARAAKAAWAEKTQGLSLKERSDALVAECDRVIVDERARKASEAAKAGKAAKSLDTPRPPSKPPSPEPPPAPEPPPEVEPFPAPEPPPEHEADEVEPYSEEEVRDWRAWAAFSARFMPQEGAPVEEAKTGERDVKPEHLARLREREGPASQRSEGVGG